MAKKVNSKSKGPEFTAAKKRAAKLRKIIDRNRYYYHVLDKPLVPDAVDDSLKHELFELEQKYPELITPDSPTQRVGGEALPEFKKVRHSKPVLSLEDAFTSEEMKDWQTRLQKLIPNQPIHYFTELKMDGLAIILTYQNGLFVRGATRGDGRLGEDVTQNLKTIESIPLRLESKYLPIPKKLEVRGEVFLSRSAFKKINAEQKKAGLPLYANPRNTAAGSIRQLDPKIAAARQLDSYIFDLMTDLGQKTHQQVHEMLKKFGFKTNPHCKYCPALADVIGYHHYWNKHRQKLDYDTDGVVVVVNDIKQQRKLGSIGKTERWMIAFKFPAEQATTIVEDIKISVGRTGALTPVAHLKPVRVAGSTVSRATLHNQDEINRLDVRLGDTVVVQKAGDVIPEITDVIKDLRTGREKKFKMPTKCPVCGSPVVKPKEEVNYYCSNQTCFAQSHRGLSHFVSRPAFNIDGLGPKIINALFKNNLIETPADLFLLKKGDLTPLERFAEKSADNLIRAIDQSKKITLARFLYALGIRHVGAETADTLANHFGSLEKIQRASLEDLEAVPDIGPIVAQSLADWFAQEPNQQLVTDLLAAGVTIQNPRHSKKSTPLTGQSFVLTGTLANLTRAEAKDLIKKNGGRVKSHVSPKTDYLLAGQNPGSKYQQAKKLKVRIIDENELNQLLSRK